MVENVAALVMVVGDILDVVAVVAAAVVALVHRSYQGESANVYEDKKSHDV